MTDLPTHGLLVDDDPLYLRARQVVLAIGLAEQVETAVGRGALGKERVGEVRGEKNVQAGILAQRLLRQIVAAHSALPAAGNLDFVRRQLADLLVAQRRSGNSMKHALCESTHSRRR